MSALRTEAASLSLVHKRLDREAAPAEIIADQDYFVIEIEHCEARAPGAAGKPAWVRVRVATGDGNRRGGSVEQVLASRVQARLGPLAFHGEMKLDFSALAPKGHGASLLEGLAQAAPAPFAMAQKHHGALVRHVLATGAEEGAATPLILKSGKEGGLREGRYLLALIERAGDAAQITFDEANRQVMAGEALAPASAVLVYRVRRVAQREDWAQIPELSAAWAEVRALAQPEGDPAAVIAALRRFQRVCVESADLTMAHAMVLSQAIEARFARYLNGAQAGAPTDLEGFEGIGFLSGLLRDPGDLRQLFLAAVVATTSIASAGAAHADPTPMAPTATAPVMEDGMVDWTPPGLSNVAGVLPGLPSNKADLFERCMEFTGKWEGGWVNHVNDRGGETNWGVTQKVLNKWQADHGKEPMSVKDLTKEGALEIYRANYWNIIKGDQLPERVALAVFDLAVNSGPGTAIKTLQRAVGVPATGEMNTATLNAVWAASPAALFNAVNDARQILYYKLVEKDEKQADFEDGWGNRLRDLRIVGGMGFGFESLRNWVERVRDRPPEEAGACKMAEPDDEEMPVADIVATSTRITKINEHPAERGHITRHGELLAVASRLADHRAPEPERGRELLDGLRKSRSFDRLHIVASEFAERGFLSPYSNHLKAQALVELGRLDEARTVISTALLRHPDKKKEALELMGLEGRIHKQLFVQSVEAGAPDNGALRASIAAYNRGWELSERKESWHGVNLAAMLHRAKVDGLAVGRSWNIEGLAGEVMALTRSAGRNAPWAHQTYGEAALALGQYEEARDGYWRYLRGETNAFSLASGHRQLTQIWRADASPDETVQRLYDDVTVALLRTPGGRIDFSPGMLRQVSERLERFNGQNLQRVERLAQADGNSGYQALCGGFQNDWSWVNRLSVLSRCVGRIESHGGVGQPYGTGFLIDAAALSGEWAQYDRVLVTNAHVSSGYGDGDLAPDRAAVRFSEVNRDAQYKLGKVLWCSKRMDHDVTIFHVPDAPRGVMKLEPPAPVSRLSAGKDGKRPGVTVIGHPSGSPTLHLGIENLSVEDADEPRMDGQPERIWYKAPTKEGNSGSPVFTWMSLETAAVHHRHIAAADCNEGISLVSIREAIRRRPEGWNGPMPVA